MYDSKENKLDVGDVVTYSGNQFSIDKTRFAIVSDLSHGSATLVFNNNKMPLIIFASYRSIKKVEKVSKDRIKSLKAVNDIYTSMQALARSI